MSKRGSEKQLRPEDEDDDAVEAGKWEEAPKEVIAARKIIKVRGSKAAPTTSKPVVFTTVAPISAPTETPTPAENATSTTDAKSSEEPANPEANGHSAEGHEASDKASSQEAPQAQEAPSQPPTEPEESVVKPPLTDFKFNFNLPKTTSGTESGFSFNFNFPSSSVTSSFGGLGSSSTATGITFPTPAWLQTPSQSTSTAANEDGDDSADANTAESLQEHNDKVIGVARPLVDLPDVKVSTGEEEEETICQSKAKLLVSASGSWTERGIGHIHLNKHISGTYRLVMRVDGTLRVILNSLLAAQTICSLDKDNAKCIRITLVDTVEEIQLRVFAIKFTSPLDASIMAEKINQAKAALEKLAAKKAESETEATQAPQAGSQDKEKATQETESQQ